MKIDRNFFQTSDLGLTAALLTLNFIIDHFDASNPTHIVFYFLQSRELSETYQNYWKGTLRVEPKTYWNTLREVKAQIRNEWG